MAYAIIPLDYITLLIYVNNSCCFALFCFIVGSDRIEILDEKENNMTRRTKCRTVDFLPETDSFVPEGRNQETTNEYVLKIEELEAMRLKDVEGLSQEECADKMNVSRQTFQKIIDSARKKVALALTKGAGIRISGGSFVTKKCKIQCMDCGHIYEPNFEDDKVTCPACDSRRIQCMQKHTHCMKLCWEDEASK